MRDRRPRIETTVLPQVIQKNYPFYGHIFTDAIVAETSFELIISNDDPHGPRIKPCTHYKYTASHSPYIGYKTYNPKGPYQDPPEWRYLEYGMHIDPIPHLVNELTSDPRWLAPPDWDRVVENGIPNFRNDMSLINFLLELDDLFEIARKILLLEKALKRRAVIGEKVRKSFLGKNVGSWDEWWLTGTFGIIPLYADIEAFYEQLFKKHTQLSRLANRLKHGYSISESAGKSGVNFAHKYDVTVEGIQCELIITCDTIIRWNCRAYGSISDSRVNHWLDLFGIYPDVSTLWNAMPFSFLVDYVVPIGKRLEADQKPWTTTDITLSEACRSIKAEGTYVLIPKEKSISSWYTDHSLVGAVQTGTISVYIREPVDDAALDGLDVSFKFDTGISDVKRTNLAALTYSYGKSFDWKNPFPRRGSPKDALNAIPGYKFLEGFVKKPRK